MNIKTLLHFNGANASTTFTDEKGRVWTAHGNAQITTADKVYGTGSGLFDGLLDYIDTPDSDDFALGSGDFTFDFRIKRNALGANELFGQRSSDGSVSSTSIRVFFSGDNKLNVVLCQGSVAYSAVSNVAIADTNWHHIAVIRSTNWLLAFLDGVAVINTDVTGVTVNNSAYKFAIGICGEVEGSGFSGNIDEFRFIKGEAAWTTDFTPPVGEYLSTYTKTLTATVISTASMVRNRLFFKALTCTVKSVASMKKTVNKTLSCVVKALGSIHRMMVNFKPLYPILTVTEYPIEMSVTEYPIKMEVLGMPKAGSTITLKGTFPDSAGNLTLLADVAVKVYGPGRVLLTTISGASVTEVSTGIYTAEYTIPADKLGQFEFEFSGTLGNKTIIGRSSFDSIWK
jgi:hypothetical protein